MHLLFLVNVFFARIYMCKFAITKNRKRLNNYFITNQINQPNFITNESLKTINA